MQQSSVPISDVMRRDVSPLPPDMPLSGVEESTTDGMRVPFLMPVASWDGRPMGLVAPRNTRAQKLVRDVMFDAVCVPEDASIEVCVQVMLRKRVNILIVTADGRYVGIVTALDLLQKLYENDRVPSQDHV